MRHVATPNAEQAEGYVSTAALFAIFSQSTKEEKAYLRLPSNWREFWSELAKSLQEVVDKADLNVLRYLRNLIREVNLSTAPDGTDLVGTTASKQTNHNGRENVTSLEVDHNSVKTSQELVDLWSSKASTASFARMFAFRKTLPIWEYKDDLLQAMEQNQAIIVCGETGMESFTAMFEVLRS